MSNKSPQSVNSLIFDSIRANDLSGITALLDSDPMFVFARSNQGHYYEWTTLHEAASLGKLNICKLLVERGAEVYTNPMASYPPVADAAWAKHHDVVEYFLREIPDKAIGTNKLGATINIAGRLGWTDIVRKHIAADPLSVHQRGWIGDSPLHWPSHNNSAEIVEMLLDAGADIEADEVNWLGGKPLQWASEHAPLTVELLLKRGANVNSRNVKEGSSFRGMTPLIVNATQRDDCSEITELLIAAGADIHAVDENGKTAFDHATERGLEKISGVLAKQT